MNHDIEAYLDGVLDAEARKDFERQMAGDPALRQAVAEARQVREDLDWLAVEHGVGQAQGRFRAKKHVRQRLRRVLLLLLAGLLLVALIVFRKKDDPAPALPDDRPALPAPPSAPAPGQNTLPPQTAPKPAAPDAGERKNRLFAAFFVPYKDPGIEPSQRGGAGMAPAERFLDHYWNDRYTEALALFETLDAGDKTNDNLLFVKANCLLATGRAAEALPLLESILRNDRSRYMAEARWYLALAYLKAEQDRKARDLLRDIASDSGSARREDAKRLLQEWK